MKKNFDLDLKTAKSHKDKQVFQRKKRVKNCAGKKGRNKEYRKENLKLSRFLKTVLLSLICSSSPNENALYLFFLNPILLSYSYVPIHYNPRLPTLTQ